MLKRLLKLKILFVFVILITGTGLSAQNGLRDEFIGPPTEDPIPLSLDEILGFGNLKVFAVSGILNLSFTNQSNGNVTIKIYDVSGREVMNEVVFKNNSQFSSQHDLSALPKSLYIVKLNLAKNQISKKVFL